MERCPRLQTARKRDGSRDRAQKGLGAKLEGKEELGDQPPHLTLLQQLPQALEGCPSLPPTLGQLPVDRHSFPQLPASRRPHKGCGILPLGGCC